MNNERVWMISTLIKLVATENVPAITSVASSLKKRFDVEEMENINDNIIYECYCKAGGVK